MDQVRVGLQIHSLREDFAEKPAETLARIAAMGYEGVEFTLGSIRRDPAYFRELLTANGLACFGCLTGWQDVQPESIAETIACNRALGSPFVVIGSVPVKLVSTPGEVDDVLARMALAQRTIQAEGFATGYHNHDSDFFHVVGGKTFFEQVFDRTSDDFVMLLDTGNALAAGFESIPLFEKYPHRSPFLHIKGYSQAKGYLAYIGEDDFDWPAVIRCAIATGGARTFSVEFGARGDYDPYERAQTSLNRVRTYLEAAQ
ncbi:MAG: sugar phosphate isomerase/epimerase [Lentisphaeria bacterium]|jgi:sugar phosphate isomerase/epimerase|nr:sugar phosphate isomerase/epimerase [Lentisphaeria bacterium]